MNLERTIHYRKSEFLEPDSTGTVYHWEPGWYFRDEEGDLYGPFLHEKQTKVALGLYLKQREKGISPTQLREHLEKLKH